MRRFILCWLVVFVMAHVVASEPARHVAPIDGVRQATACLSRGSGGQRLQATGVLVAPGLLACAQSSVDGGPGESLSALFPGQATPHSLRLESEDAVSGVALLRILDVADGLPAPVELATSLTWAALQPVRVVGFPLARVLAAGNDDPPQSIVDSAIGRVDAKPADGYVRLTLTRGGAIGSEGSAVVLSDGRVAAIVVAAKEGDRPAIAVSAERLVACLRKVTNSVPAPRDQRTQHALSARKKPDSSGRLHTAVTGQVDDHPMSIRPVAIAIPPRGSPLYLIAAEPPVLLVLDPESFTQLEEIPLPVHPTALWCDDQSVVVACARSRVVVELDAATRRVARTLRPPRQSIAAGAPRCSPRFLIGRDPAGQISALCDAAEGEPDLLVSWDSQGGALDKTLPEGITWAWWTARRQVLLPFSGGICGVLDVYAKEPAAPLPQLPGGAHWADRTLSVRMAADGEDLLVPLSRAPRGEGPVTWVTDCRYFHGSIPGLVLAEDTVRRVFIGWLPGGEGASFCWASRSTGRIVRHITINGVPPASVHADAQARLSAYSRRDETLIAIVDGALRRWRLGPVDPEFEVPPDPKAPPDEVPVGTTLRWTFAAPDLPAARHWRAVGANQPSGLRLDPDSGSLTWTPVAADRGTHQIPIGAEVGGRIVTIQDWRVRVP